MDTETLDKLYLEWSQFTNARTAREIRFAALLLEAFTQYGDRMPSGWIKKAKAALKIEGLDDVGSTGGD